MRERLGVAIYQPRILNPILSCIQHPVPQQREFASGQDEEAIVLPAGSYCSQIAKENEWRRFAKNLTGICMILTNQHHRVGT